MENKVKILMKEFVTHDVKRFIIEKPSKYKFVPGQATEVSINKEGLENKKRPFTFTSLNEDLVLEFTIKRYAHDGVTERLHELKAGDELILGDAWGEIGFKGKGIFIAGGAGVTPFIAILRQLQRDGELQGNKLIFSNKTKKDIILKKELKNMFPPEDLILTLTEEKEKGYENRKIDKEFLKEKIFNLNQKFYICGSKEFVKDIYEILKNMGINADSIIIEGGIL